MPNMKNNAAAQETRRKLINAAGEIFAELGLHAATIKQITDRAGVNIAAINYHFRDKFELYAAVVRYVLSFSPVVPPSEKLAGSPEDRLRAYINGVIEDAYDPSRPAWRATVLAHELAQPTAALDAVMDELIRPRADHLRDMVRDILGPNAPEEQVLRAAQSVASQCFFYLYNREAFRRLYPQQVRDNTSKSLAAHIAEFSLDALHAMRNRQDPGRQQR